MISSLMTKLVNLAFWAFWENGMLCKIRHDNIDDGKK